MKVQTFWTLKYVFRLSVFFLRNLRQACLHSLWEIFGSILRHVFFPYWNVKCLSFLIKFLFFDSSEKSSMKNKSSNHWSLNTPRIIEGRLVHYSLQAYSMFGVYIIYSFIIYRVRHKWVLCAPQICISFLWLACKKIWWAFANFGGKFK